MAHRLFHIVTGISVVVCVSMGVLWMQSYWRAIGISLSTSAPKTIYGSTEFLSLSVQAGEVWFSYSTPSDERDAVRRVNLQSWPAMERGQMQFSLRGTVIHLE